MVREKFKKLSKRNLARKNPKVIIGIKMKTLKKRLRSEYLVKNRRKSQPNRRKAWNSYKGSK